MSEKFCSCVPRATALIADALAEYPAPAYAGKAASSQVRSLAGRARLTYAHPERSAQGRDPALLNGEGPRR